GRPATACFFLRPGPHRVSMPSNAEPLPPRPRPMSAPDPPAAPVLPAPPGQPRLLDRVREAARVRPYSYRREEAYGQWIRRFILHHGKRHPLEMGAAQINAFLTHLAVDGHVSASTQNQALAALLFLYEKVLDRQQGELGAVVRAKRPLRLPVVLTADEVGRALDRLEGTPRLVAQLLSAGGLGRLDGCRRRGRAGTSGPQRSPCPAA